MGAIVGTINVVYSLFVLKADDSALQVAPESCDDSRIICHMRLPELENCFTKNVPIWQPPGHANCIYIPLDVPPDGGKRYDVDASPSFILERSVFPPLESNDPAIAVPL